MLILTRKPGQSFFIDDNIEIKIIEVQGESIKIGIEAPVEMKILRNELRQTIDQNKEAAQSVDPSLLGKFKLKRSTGSQE